jgi:hypothetical protein
MGAPVRYDEKREKTMAESIIFQCDMCGQKSEEEPAALPRRERSRVELVFRGQRFVLAPPTLVEAPMGPLPASWGVLPTPPGMFPLPLPMPWPAEMPVTADPSVPASPIDEDERVSYTICDACMKRTCAFFDLKVETFEEYSGRVTREADIARRASIPLPGNGGGMQGKMVQQYPTRERTPAHGPGPGGLVDQFPTPGSASVAPVSVNQVPGTEPEAESPPAAEAE